MPEPVNTTQRWSHFCRAKHADGRICNLYSPHEGGHLPKHGLEKDRWEDSE